MKTKLKIIVFVVMVTIVVSSCTPIENNTVTVSTSTPLLTPNTQPQLPTRTLIPAFPPTPSPILPEQISRVYFHIGESNTCKLPCILGITPGETTWNDTLHLFAPYTVSITDGIVNNNDLIPYVVTLVLSELELQTKYYVSLESEKVVFIRMNNSTPVSEYLSTLGLPDQVQLNSAGAGGIGNGFNLAIAYFKRGVIAYLDGEFEIVDGKAQICSDQLRKIQMIVLWSPEDIRFIGDLVNLDGYVGIEATTNTTIEEFYENYSKDNSSYCFQLNY